MEKKPSNEYIKISLVLLLSICLILFTQGIKLLKNPASTPITFNTIQGLVVLWAFSMIGVFISTLVKKTNIKVLADFPILGWVSLTSLFFCLLSDFLFRRLLVLTFYRSPHRF